MAWIGRGVDDLSYPCCRDKPTEAGLDSGNQGTRHGSLAVTELIDRRHGSWRSHPGIASQSCQTRPLAWRDV